MCGEPASNIETVLLVVTFKKIKVLSGCWRGFMQTEGAGGETVGGGRLEKGKRKEQRGEVKGGRGGRFVLGMRGLRGEEGLDIHQGEGTFLHERTR